MCPRLTPSRPHPGAAATQIIHGSRQERETSAAGCGGDSLRPNPAIEPLPELGGGTTATGTLTAPHRSSWGRGLPRGGGGMGDRAASDGMRGTKCRPTRGTAVPHHHQGFKSPPPDSDGGTGPPPHPLPAQASSFPRGETEASTKTCKIAWRLLQSETPGGLHGGAKLPIGVLSPLPGPPVTQFPPGPPSRTPPQTITCLAVGPVSGAR